MWNFGKTTPPSGPVITDPFAVIPLRPEDVVVRQDSSGCICLRRFVKLDGLRKRVAEWIGYDYSRKVELDEHGTLYYGMVDGFRNLRLIVDRMTEVSGRDRKVVEEGVVLFTKKLMTMNMLVLKVPEAVQERP